MRNRSQRIAVIMGCGCALLLTACSNASGSKAPSTKLVRAPWSEIARGRDSTTLLINTDQSTTDRSGSCFIHYTTRVVSQTSHRITIELLAPSTEGRPFRCVARGVRGPFLVPVHLKKRYRGQKLLDPVTGHFYPLTPRSELH